MKIKNQKSKMGKGALGIIFVISFIFSGIIILPVNVLGIEPTDKDFQLVPTDCGNSFAGKSLGECGWTHLIELITNIMKFLIYISVSIAVLASCYAGFLYITAFGETGKVEQAHKIFRSTIVGMVIIMLAWLIVATLLKVLKVPAEFRLLNTDNVETITTGSS